VKVQRREKHDEKEDWEVRFKTGERMKWKGGSEIRDPRFDT